MDFEQQGQDHDLDQDDDDPWADIDAAQVGHDIPNRSQDRLGDPKQEVANGPDHAVAGVEHAKRGEHAEQGGQDNGPLVEIDDVVDEFEQDIDHAVGPLPGVGGS